MKRTMRSVVVGSLVAILLATAVFAAMAEGEDPVAQVQVGAVVTCAAFSSDGAYLAVGCMNGMVKAFSTESWELEWEKQVCDGGQVPAIAFSPDGRILASSVAGEPVVLFLNARTGRETKRVEIGEEFGEIEHVAFSPGGELLACGEMPSNGDDVRVKLVDSATGEDLGTPIQYPAYTVAAAIQVAFSADGRLLICGAWGTVVVWDLDAQAEIQRLPTPGIKAYNLHGVAISPDGGLLAMVGGEARKALLWDTETWTPTSIAANGANAVDASVAFSPDGRFLALGHSDFVIRDAQTRTLLWSQSASRRGTTWVGFSPDSSLLAGVAFSSATVTVWNVNELVGE